MNAGISSNNTWQINLHSLGDLSKIHEMSNNPGTTRIAVIFIRLAKPKITPEIITQLYLFWPIAQTNKAAANVVKPSNGPSSQYLVVTCAIMGLNAERQATRAKPSLDVDNLKALAHNIMLQKNSA